MSYSSDIASCTTTLTSRHQCTSLTQTLQMVLEAVGSSRKVSLIQLISNYFITGKDDKNAGIKEGCWDAIHLVTTTIDG